MQSKGYYAIQGHRIWYHLKAHMWLPVILLVRYNLQKVQNSYIWLPFLHLTSPPPTEGFPWDDLRKSLPGCQHMAKVLNSVETLLKISVAWVGRMNVTDGRATWVHVG